MPDSRDLADLHPHVCVMAERLLADSAAAGIPLTVDCTLRSMATQAALYAQGRTRPGPVVTNAKPGHSYHNFGLALDVAPTELLHLPHWGDTPDHQARTDAIWAQVGAIGKAIGFRWGGEFSRLRDRPHFEWSDGLSLADLRAGARPSLPPALSPDPDTINRGAKDMKINLGKLVTVLAHAVIAAPAVIAAIKPVVDELKTPAKPIGQTPELRTGG